MRPEPFHQLLLCGLVFLSSATLKAAPPTRWHGFERENFTCDGRKCFVVKPTEPAPGRPWVWRARFPNYHPEVDLILLKHGFHVANIDTNGMLGSDKALDHWDKFYDHVTGPRHELAKKVALEAVSRGGLFVYRWAARHPDRVACIYADTPVCDIKSWPLGQGKGVGHEATWKSLLKEYGLTEDEALAYRRNPIDLLRPIAEARIPILHIVSENDRIVPPAENTYVLQERLRALGGRMRVMCVEQGTVESNGHHFPHPDPGTPARFVLRHTLTSPPKSPPQREP